MKQSHKAQWLSIVGIGENGLEGLNTSARAKISSAKLVLGGKRHLELAAELITGESKEWPSPLAEIIPELLAMRPEPVCVLASGDPFTYGVGSTLVRHIPLGEMDIYPQPSIFTLAASRLGWALQDTVTIGLNGRPLERIIPYLQPNAKIIALSTDEATPVALAMLLKQRGFGDSHITVLERLGGPQERVRTSKISDFSMPDIARLNCIAIELSDDVLRCLPVGGGLPDDMFEHDGQITKREIRAVTLSALAPRRGELLWDIGLGAGSVAIEWMLANPANRAIGFEKNPERAARAKRNALSLGVPDLKIIEGAAPATLAGLEAPDAVFIGGGTTSHGMIETVWAALKPGGRLVVNAIALETEALLLAAHKQYGGQLIRIGIERANPVSPAMTGWRPAMTVMQWSGTKI